MILIFNIIIFNSVYQRQLFGVKGLIFNVIWLKRLFCRKKKKKNLLDTTFILAGTDKVDVTNLVILVTWWKSYSEQINLIPAHYTIISNQLLPLNKKFLPIIIIFFILFSIIFLKLIRFVNNYFSEARFND